MGIIIYLYVFAILTHYTDYDIIILLNVLNRGKQIQNVMLRLDLTIILQAGVDMLEENYIAKSGSTSSEWLPLWMHHEDTGGIMQYLLDEFISESFCVSCGISSSELRKISLFAAYVHDIGKATIGFQYKISLKVTERIEALEHFGVFIPDIMDMNEIRKTPHCLAGEEILSYSGCNDSIAAIIGSHHGTPYDTGKLFDQNLNKNNKDIEGYENYFGTASNRELFEKSWKKIIDKALKKSGMDLLSDLPVISSNAQMLISGLLIAADWIASNTEYFPLINIDNTGSEGMYPDRIEKAWSEIEFPNIWQPTNEQYYETLFKNTFGFESRKMQRNILDIVGKSENPGLFILEAPMGEGKTEAALASAEILAAKLHKKGVFFGLPTQATANGIFPRIQQWAGKQSDEDYHSIQLKHGSSALNETFQKIQRGIPGDEEESESGLIVHSWFCDSKRSCLADFVVATVDQMLMSALKRRHVMLLHLGLSEKVVVIDEVHAYDAYMNQYLEMALRWLGAYHTPVILLSATLPAQRRMSLIRAYLQIKKSDSSFEENISYPLLTWTDCDEIKQEALESDRKSKSVLIKLCHNDDIAEIAKKAVQSGGCVGIIMNTVSRAQKMYDELHCITDDIILYHAQYIMPDRLKKEDELLKRIGKSSTYSERNGLIVIGTQVLEQSLDIDFDLLITDICPIDLLLQRIGRLHRHTRSERPEAFRAPVCCVVADEYENESITGSKRIYGEWLLKETFRILPEKIILPDDISPLVQKVYSAHDDSREYNDFISDQDIKKSKAEAFRLKSPKCRDIHNMFERCVNDRNNDAEASVRDGLSSIEALVMKKKTDGSVYFIDDTPLAYELTEDECIKIASQILKLPSAFCQKWNADKTIRELEEKCKPYIVRWQTSYLLNGKLVLFLDENAEAELGGYRLKYSFEYGLKYAKESGENE